jgi:hypothetical protein
MSSMILKPGRADSEAFRTGLALSLHGRGIPAIPARTEDARRLQPLDNTERGDLWGVPGWTLITRTESRRQLAPGVRLAESLSVTDGKPNAAAVWRSGTTAGGALVVMSWKNFLNMLDVPVAPTGEENDVAE